MGMCRVADVREELLATLTALADFSYGWGLLEAYLPPLQAAVRAPDPRSREQMLAQGLREHQMTSR